MSKAAIGFYAVLFVGLLLGLIVTLSESPLFPFKTDDTEWLQDWLFFTVRSRIVTLDAFLHVF
jgi:hypothetical protein